jgi:predicted DNA-binding transcriptional regulator YafY
MLEILTLLSGNFVYSISEIAEKKSISERTVYRYIETFENSGFVFSKQGNRLKIDRKNSQEKQLSDLLHFSEEEAYILSKAIHSIDENNTIKSNLVKKLYSLYNFDRVAETIVKKEHSENVHKIIRAIKAGKQAVLCSYQSAHGNTISDRLIEPIEFSTNYISVWCFELATGETKLFKIARIKEVKISDNHCCNQLKFKVEKIDVFRISSHDNLPVKLQLSLRAKNLLIEEYPLAEQYISNISNSIYHFETHVCAWEGVARFVMGLIDEITVLHPPELKKFIKKKNIKYAFDGSCQ